MMVGFNMSNELECGLSKNTELLTPNGWINIRHVTTKIPVLQYSEDGYMSFAKPLGIRKTYVDRAVELTNLRKHFKQITHPSHAIPVIGRRSNFLKVYSADTIGINSEAIFINVGNTYRENIPKLSPVEKIKIIFMCVGRFKHRGKKHDTIYFTIEGADKLYKLTTLLKECGFECQIKNQTNDQITISSHVGINQIPDNYDWVNNSVLTPNWCVEFMDELFSWARSVHKNDSTCSMCSFSNIEHARNIQTVATLAGYRTSVKQRYQYRRERTFNTVYINTVSKTTSSNLMVKNSIQYNADMYNVITPTNMLVMKLDDAVSVTGCYGVDKPRGLVINRDFMLLGTCQISPRVIYQIKDIS